MAVHSLAEAPADLAVFLCEHVGRGGRPILLVVHDPEGDWQFLCGGDHSDDDQPMVVHLEHVLEGDATVKDVGKMSCNSSATRASLGAPWKIVDEMEETVRRNIREHGWHVMIVGDDDDGPGFAYSIGLDPELIVFGLPGELMQAMINDLGARLRAGVAVVPGAPIEELLEGAVCVPLEVDRTQYPEYLGYALWYHQGPRFRTLQIVWPGKVNGKLPWEPGGEALRDRQPILGTPAAAPSG